MKIDVLKLREQPYEYEAFLPAAYLAEGSEDDSIAFSDGRGLVTFHMVGNEIFADGELQTECRGVCARCLGPATAVVRAEAHLVYWPREAETGSKIPDIEPEGPDFATYEGEQLDPDEELREALLVEAPLVLLCGEDCKGLCAGCGADLNKEPCRCAAEEEERTEENPAAEAPWKKKLRGIALPKGE